MNIEQNGHEMMANSHPSLGRGMVWCRKCGNVQSINAANCLKSGWPKCCGFTMTIDSPCEQSTDEGVSDE